MNEEESDSEGDEQAETEIATVIDSENLSTAEIKIDKESCDVKIEDLSQTNARTDGVKTEEKEPEAVVKPVICSVCNQEFESRNKLFEHIKEEGHAATKSAPKKAPDANSKAKNKNKKLRK